MKLFNIFIKKTAENKIENITLVKEGFSWTAFIFSNFWFLYHKMWREFFALTIVSLFLTLVSDNFSDFDKFSIQIALAIIIGLNANYWLMTHLQKKNHQFSGIILGNDLLDAKLKFIENYKSIIGGEDFDIAILDPKLHKKITKEKKSQPYF